MNNRNDRPITRSFGEPVDFEVLLEIAKLDEEDLEFAIQWWDETASDDWIGVLDSTPTR